MPHQAPKRWGLGDPQSLTTVRPNLAKAYLSYYATIAIRQYGQLTPNDPLNRKPIGPFILHIIYSIKWVGI